MNRILSFFVLFVLFVSCDHNDKFYENPVSLSDIKLLSIRADHKMLLPDGKGEDVFLYYSLRDKGVTGLLGSV